MKLVSRHFTLGQALVLGALFATAVGCGSSSTTGGGASTTIGSAGGTVSLPGGPTVQIPSGALSANTTITIQTAGQTPSGAPIFSFGPDGTQFAQAVTVQLPVPAGTTSPAIYWSRPGSTSLYDALQTTVSGGNATAQVTHFSLGFVGTSDSAATPTFSPPAGTYTAAQSVTISSTTPGAAIHYTTDGSTPTAASPAFASAISVAATTTLKAVAIATGFGDSAVATAAYTITAPPPVAATPTFSPVAGTYTTAQSVTISSTTPGAVIHYTTDGSTPTSASATYAAPVAVATTTTLKAIATATGYTASAVATAIYTIGGGGGPGFAEFCQQEFNSFVTLFGTCLHANPDLLGGVNQIVTNSCAEIQKAIAAGRAVYHPTQGAECQAALGSLTCSTLALGEAPPSCEAALTGTVANGGACYDDVDCQAGTCTSTAQTCPGACQAFAQLGQSCATLSCAPSLTCDAGTCKTPSTAGGACPCRGDLWCDTSGGGAGVCKATQTSGTCSASAQCALGYTCAGTPNTCQSMVGLNGNCTASADLCGPGYKCVSNVCVSYPKVGEACSEFELCIGGYCDSIVTQKCVAYKAAGATCLLPTECASLSCTAGHCDAAFCAEP
jgi:hypothetical protein